MIRHLGYGKTRSVYLIGKWVFKIPRLRYLFKGIAACYREWNRWHHTHSIHLAPIVFSIPGLLNVMPYLEVRTWVMKEPITYFHDLAVGLGLREVKLSAGNIGWIGRKAKAIDYGAKNMDSYESMEPYASGWLI